MIDDAVFAKVRKSCDQQIQDIFEDCLDLTEGDSPIERAFCFALLCRSRIGQHEYDRASIVNENEEAIALECAINNRSLELIISCQKHMPSLENWRVDFLVRAVGFDSKRGGAPYVRRLIVECDGHEFHERTKEQAARDRRRDRMAQEKGIAIFRFTGSQIWADPWECAGEVFNWAAGGL